MINNVVLMGRITRDLEPRQTPNGVTFTRFTVAVDGGYGDKKRTDFISCIAWRGTADFISKYFRKGDMIAVVGKIITGSYEKDGQKIYTFDVQVDEASFTGSKKSDSSTVSDGEFDTSEDDDFDLF